MIKELNDIEVINSFLKEFNCYIDPFKKYIGYMLDDKIVAFLNYSLIYERIEIEYIYTNSNYRNNGIASELLEYLVNLGINNNCLNITLEVRRSNITAINFYQKNGFKKVSTRKNYYNNEDGILMLRKLV